MGISEPSIDDFSVFSEGILLVRSKFLVVRVASSSRRPEKNPPVVPAGALLLAGLVGGSGESGGVLHATIASARKGRHCFMKVGWNSQYNTPGT